MPKRIVGIKSGELPAAHHDTIRFVFTEESFDEALLEVKRRQKMGWRITGLSLDDGPNGARIGILYLA